MWRLARLLQKHAPLLKRIDTTDRSLYVESINFIKTCFLLDDFLPKELGMWGEAALLDPRDCESCQSGTCGCEF